MDTRPPPPPPRPPFCTDDDGDPFETAILAPVNIHANSQAMSNDKTAPIVNADSQVRVKLGDLIKWGGAIVAATVWAWSLWSDVQRLKDESRETRTEMKRVAEDVATIKRVVSLPPSYAVSPLQSDPTK